MRRGSVGVGVLIILVPDFFESISGTIVKGCKGIEKDGLINALRLKTVHMGDSSIFALVLVLMAVTSSRRPNLGT